MSQHCDRATFLANLQQSGLISARDWPKVVEGLPEGDRGRVIARHLVEKRFITKFQAELLLIGRTSGFFLGQYKILDQLGQGGMGRVYKAEHQTMRRVVALKILAPQLVTTGRAQKLFQREVRAAAQLNHPNIVTAYDANQIADRHYLVMEYIDGPNLFELVKQMGVLPIGLACEIIRQAACGLECAREMNLVHRDIKPANILVQKPGKNQPLLQVKIVDFGLARLHDPEKDAAKASVVTASTSVLGTADFIAPEQARDQYKADIRSDLYSLGCTFYFLLTKQVPFPGGSAVEKLVRHAHEMPEPVETLRPDTPEPVREILKKLLAKEPDQRFQTPGDLAAALAPLSDGRLGSWDKSASSNGSPTSGDLSDRNTPQLSDDPLPTGDVKKASWWRRLWSRFFS